MAPSHVCNAYCAEPIHALVITARAGTRLEVIARWARCMDYVLHDLRQALEIDLPSAQARQKYCWDAVTGEMGPYLSSDALPTDEVWLVRVSKAPARLPWMQRAWARVAGWGRA